VASDNTGTSLNFFEPLIRQGPTRPTKFPGVHADEKVNQRGMVFPFLGLSLCFGIL
jgi:hypothetical protein